MHIKFLLENLKIRDRSEDLRVDGRIILEGIVGTWSLSCGLGECGSE
jgi:hypothetical protein